MASGDNWCSLFSLAVETFLFMDSLGFFYLSILQNPNNIKYRQVKLTNPKIETKLLPAAGKGSAHNFY